MNKKITLPFFLIFWAITSCNKDTSADYPKVTISTPYSLASFGVPGSIMITGHVSDSKNLTSLLAYVSDAQNIAVEEKVQIPITSNNMDFSCNYILNDIHLPTGEYYVTISAFNGTNGGSAFQQIYIEEAPTVRTAIYAITRNSAGVHAWKIDSVFHASVSYTEPGDYSSSDINTYYQQLYIAGYDSGNVNVNSVPAASSQWNISAPSSPTPYFTNVYCNNDAELISYYYSSLCYVRRFNHSGAFQAIYNAFAGYYPIKTFLWEGWLLSEEKSISLSGSENLHVYYEASSSSAQQIMLDGPVVAMYGYDNSHVFVFGNNSRGGAYMVLYNISANLFYPPISLPSAQLLSVAQLNSNTYLMSFDNGTIYQYTYNPNSIVPYLNGITASVVRYDSINNEILVSSGNTLNEYSYSVGSAAFITSATLTDSIRDVRILYNK